MNVNFKNEKVSNYLYTYKDKIVNNNKLGLFDEAKYYENFALNICNCYFNQEFRNLNLEKNNFPDIDLISRNNEIAIQVTTQKNMNQKIAKTLENFENNKYKSVIKKLYFFVLENYTTDSIKKYENDNFTVNNIIDIKKIVDKSTNDNEFLNKIYEIVIEDEKNYNLIQNQYFQEVSFSKKCIEDINSKIEDYEIDRTKLIKKIIKEDYKNIIIEGEAGIGKSALCKSIVKIETNILFLRAEKIVEVNNINEFWNFDINSVLKYLNNTRLIIFIDSLELISDMIIKYDNLKKLFEIAEKYDNVKILASCRTNEINYFLDIIQDYKIKTYRIEKINNVDQIRLIYKFPFLKDYYTKYNNLLCIPFYVNQLVKLYKSGENISENNFRKQIWKKIINNDEKRKNIINEIAIERVKKHLYGVNKYNYDLKIINDLISDEILVENNELLRFKFDIFEDICFDEYINKIYIDSKNNIKVFFDNLKYIGRSWYRRYQIWIENKLLSNNDITILNKIILSKYDNEIVKQTIIGIIKSNYCKCFFDEMYELFNDEYYLNLFIDITNKNGFEISNNYDEEKFINYRPTGNARMYLVKYILKQNQNYLYENEERIIKLVYYLTNEEIIKEDLFKNIEKLLCSYLKKHFINKEASIQIILNIYYKFANLYKKEISNIFSKVIDYYKNNKKYKTFCENIINLTIENSNFNLLSYNGNELVNLIEQFWCYGINFENNYYGYDRYKLSDFGLNNNSEYFDRKKNKLKTLFKNLFISNKESIYWAISFINKLVNNFKNNNPNISEEFEIYFANEDDGKKYYGNSDFWTNDEVNYTIPNVLTIISDSIIYAIKYRINNFNDIEFANKYKNEVYNKANNILLLRTILEIGKENIEKLPGYAIDMCTNINFIYFDINLTVKNITFQRTNMLELRNYMINTQIYCKSHNKDKILKQCEKALDFLKNKYQDKNDEVEFQIQNMDIRNFQKIKIDGVECFKQVLYGNGKKYYESYLLSSKKDKLIEDLIKQYNESKLNNKIDIEVAFKIIEMGKNEKYRPLYFDKVIDCIVDLLKSNYIDNNKKDELINFWICCLNEIKNNNLYFYNFEKTINLFDQIYKNKNEFIISDIKYVMFDLLDPVMEYNVGMPIRNIIINYIKEHKDLGISFFNTYLALSKNEMNIQKKLFEYYKEFGENFEPHGQPKLYLTDELKEKLKLKIDDKQIIEAFLIRKENLILKDFDINDYEIQKLIQGLYIGCNIENEEIDKIILITFKKVIEILQRPNKLFSHDDIISLDNKYDLGYIYSSCLYNKEIYNQLINIFFNDKINYNENIYELYNRSFINNLKYYFDGYKNHKLREKCKNILNIIESKLNQMCIKDNKLYDYVLMINENERELGDWSKCKTNYSLLDIQFIGEKIAKYGKYNFNGVLRLIDRMQINHMLPEILIYLSKLIDEIKIYNYKIDIKNIRIVQNIVYSSLIYYRQEILADEELTNSYENILEFLIDNSFINAQLILDEFRTH